MKKAGALLAWVIVVMVVVVGCTAAQPETAATAEVTSGVEVPAEVTAVRDSAVEFLRASAAVCVPPAGAVWHSDRVENEATAGANVYRFTSEACTLTISYPQPPPDETVYYAAYHNAETAFCWQAFIAEGGRILSTGYDAVPENAANPAAVYCEDQGYRFEIITKEDGTPCSACVFPDGSACQSWDFFYGTCAPGENPAP